MRLEPALVNSFEELLDLVVNKDTRVELVNHSLNGWFSPKLFEHGSLLTGGSVPVSFRNSSVCIKAKSRIAVAATHICPYVRSRMRAACTVRYASHGRTRSLPSSGWLAEYSALGRYFWIDVTKLDVRAHRQACSEAAGGRRGMHDRARVDRCKDKLSLYNSRCTNKLTTGQQTVLETRTATAIYNPIQLTEVRIACTAVLCRGYLP